MYWNRHDLVNTNVLLHSQADIAGRTQSIREQKTTTVTSRKINKQKRPAPARNRTDIETAGEHTSHVQWRTSGLEKRRSIRLLTGHPVNTLDRLKPPKVT